MSALTKSHVYAANATALGDLAAPTSKLATTMSGSANKVHGTIFGLAWDGTGKRAAEDRANLELAQDKRVTGTYDSLASAFTAGHAAMQPMIELLTRKGHGLEADSFSVSETWQVADNYDYTAGDRSLEAAGFSEDERREIIEAAQHEFSHRIDGIYRDYNFVDGFLEANPDVISRFRGVEIEGQIVDFVDERGNPDFDAVRTHNSEFSDLVETLPLDDWDDSQHGFDKGLNEINIDPNALPLPSDGSLPSEAPR